MSDRTRTRIGRRRPCLIVGVALTAASLIYLAGFPPIIPMLLVLSINAFFLNVAVDPYMALLADLVPIDQRGRVGALLAILNMLGQIAATVAALVLWDRSPELVFLIVPAALVISFGITTIIKEPESPPRPSEPMGIDVGGYLRDLAGRRDLPALHRSRCPLLDGYRWRAALPHAVRRQRARAERGRVLSTDPSGARRHDHRSGACRLQRAAEMTGLGSAV